MREKRTAPFEWYKEYSSIQAGFVSAVLDGVKPEEAYRHMNEEIKKLDKKYPIKP